MTFSFSIVNTDQTFKLKRGYSLLNNLLLNKISTHGKCGGKALCGGCRVKVIAGLNYCNKPVAEEKVILNPTALKEGWRLACQTYCLQSIKFYIPSQKEIKTL